MRTILRQRLWIAALVAAIGLASWRLTLIAGQPSQKNSDVRLVPPGQAAGGNPGQKGATYYALEGQTSRFTTEFLDGTKAVAERGLDGDVVTRLEDAEGNEINRLRVDRIDGVNDVVQYLRTSGQPVQALLDSRARPTLDWSNRQSHRFHQDKVVSGAGLQWSDGLIRRAGAPDKDEERDVVSSVKTQWANGLSARTTRKPSTRGQTFEGRAIEGDILVTHLMRDGVPIGVADYFTHERIYAWRIPGLTAGVITNENLKARHGGWPFTPDMVWMNLEAIGLYHWKTKINEKGSVARQAPPRTSNPILQFFAPTLSANEAGCDDLHWLDGTALRFCCDVHDLCYEKAGCSSSTWWEWWSSWRCDMCNMGAIRCFAHGGVPRGSLEY